MFSEQFIQPSIRILARNIHVQCLSNIVRRGDRGGTGRWTLACIRHEYDSSACCGREGIFSITIASRFVYILFDSWKCLEFCCLAWLCKSSFRIFFVSGGGYLFWKWERKSCSWNRSPLFPYFFKRLSCSIKNTTSCILSSANLLLHEDLLVVSITLASTYTISSLPSTKI